MDFTLVLAQDPGILEMRTFFNIGFFPAYKNENFTFSAKLDFYVNCQMAKVSKSNCMIKITFLKK